MTTTQELNTTINDLKSRIAALELEFDAAKTEYRIANELSQQANEEYIRLSRSGTATAAQIADALARTEEAKFNIPDNPNTIYPSQIQALQQQLSSYEKLANAATDLPTTSAGQVAIQQQAARDDDANRILPEPPPLQLSPNGRIQAPPASPVISNAERPGPGDEDFGTNDVVKPVSQTQAVPSTAPSANDDGGNAFEVVTKGIIPAAFASSDDNINPTRQTLVRYFGASPNTIEPRPNVLANYSSYTYNISIYLMSPEDARRVIETKRPLVSNSQLLIQSGGAPLRTNLKNNTNGTGTATAPTPNDANAPLGRNPEFLLDYYIDDVRIKQLQPGKGSRASNGIVSLDFTITEPNGITLIDNLYQAVEKYVGKKENYARQTYLMVIRFYGYDKDGNLVLANNSRSGSDITDPQAVIEKYIPFMFTAIKFRIANKMVEYSCSAVVPQNNVATAQPRGVIPYNVESSATTVKELFTSASATSTVFNPDNNQVQSTSAPQKANSAPKPTITTGIITAMNEFEDTLVETGVFDVANQYEIVFTDSIIADAQLMPTGSTQKNQTSTTPTGNPTQLISGAKQSVNTDNRKLSAIAGTSLIQFLDQVLRSSQYIFDQQTFVIDPDTGEPKPQGSGQGASVLAWYRITAETRPIKWDPKRNDYAYKITYQVSPYLINDLQSPWFPQTQYRGIHKRYNYWFTGQNTEVLNYEQDFNYLYYMVVKNHNQIPETAKNLDWRESIPRQHQPNSNESSKGLSNNVNEPGANAAERLYSPSDLAIARMTILGDPAWIFQGDVWRGISSTSTTSEPFFPDGTINHEIQEALFEISFNKPADYSIETGMIDPSGRIFGGNKVNTIEGENAHNFIYRAISINSTFSKGRFTQDIEGALVQFPRTAVTGEPTRESLEQFYTEAISPIVQGVQNITNKIGSTLGKIFAPILGGNNPDTSSQNPYTPTPTPVSAKPAQPPTSSGQNVYSDGNWTKFSLNELLKVDPDFAKEFNEYQKLKANQLIEEGESPSFADTLARRVAINRYRDKLLSYGPAVYQEGTGSGPGNTTGNNTQQGATVSPQAPQIISREF